MGATRVIAVNALRFIAPPGFSTLVKGVRWIGAKTADAPPPAQGGPEVITITPKVYLGKMMDGARWRRDRIERWIEMGEADASAVCESIHSLLQ